MAHIAHLGRGGGDGGLIAGEATGDQIGPKELLLQLGGADERAGLVAAVVEVIAEQVGAAGGGVVEALRGPLHPALAIGVHK